MDEETELFLSKLEHKHGGKLTWKTFSTWYGCSDGTQREYGVFLFRVFDTFHFEDFEKNSTIFGIPLTGKPKRKKGQKEFVQMERSFEKDNVVKITTTTRTIANSIVKTGNTAILKNATGFDKIFRKLVTAVSLQDGTVHFFELIAPKEFINENK